ncbi:MAG TPA: universal stress protein [Pseudonocardia sp.]|jgi:nucleotide-binding universal stress UspA family protein|nr:universal stress protein [Pseudonocardia sp.]
MGPGSTAFAQPTVTAHSRLIVMQAPDTPLPRWLVTWRNRAGFELVSGPAMPAAEAQPCPGVATGWSRVISDIAEATAAGAAVLINRPSWSEPEEPRVVAAVQQLPEDADVLTDAATCAAVLHGTVLVLHGMPVSFAERSVGLDSALNRGLDTLEAGVRFIEEQRFGVPATSELLRVHPHELVNDRLEANLLVVGGSRVGGTPGLGRVARSAVRLAPYPVVITPRHWTP